MKWLITLIVELVRLLLPALLERAAKRSEDADSQRELRDRLRARVRQMWRTALLAILLLVPLSGCAVRTIYVPEGTPVRLRETVKRAKVWIMDQSGQTQAADMDLPEGWYCLSVPQEQEDADAR